MASPYLHLLRAQLRSQASYRASFAIDVAGNVVVLGVDLLALLVMFRVAPALGGFSVREAVFLFALTNTGFALADLAVGNVERIRQYVRTGLLGVAVTQVDIDWTPARALLFVLTPLAGAVFFGAIFVASATVAFWWIESGEIANSLTYGGRDFASYPITVYSGLFRHAFAYGLGFGFVSYYPALALLGRTDPLGLPAWVGWTSPLVAVAAAGAASAVWRVAVRHYRSTGS